MIITNTWKGNPMLQNKGMQLDPISLSHLKYFFIPPNPKHAYLVSKKKYH
jgi:hypothetical protein